MTAFYHFAMMKRMKPTQVQTRVIRKDNLAGNFWSVWMERGGIEYEAGQYLSLKVSEEGQRRSYSLASYPQENDLQMVVDVTPMGKGSKYILGLETGQMVEILVPVGGFEVLPEQRAETTKGFLLVGTGSGIVPLRSMIFDLLKVKKETRPVQLNWGMRYEKNLFWTKEFLDLQKEYTNFKFDLVLSKPTETWTYCRGHVGDCLVGHKMDFTGWQAYLCGSKEMIAEVGELLVNHGIGRESVHFEKFY